MRPQSYTCIKACYSFVTTNSQFLIDSSFPKSANTNLLSSFNALLSRCLTSFMKSWQFASWTLRNCWMKQPIGGGSKGGEKREKLKSEESAAIICDDVCPRILIIWHFTVRSRQQPFFRALWLTLRYITLGETWGATAINTPRKLHHHSWNDRKIWSRFSFIFCVLIFSIVYGETWEAGKRNLIN